MEPKRWKKIEAAFHAIRELPESERHKKMSELRQRDPDLTGEVESLLLSAESDDDILSQSVFSAGLDILSSDPRSDEPIPENIGIYSIQKLIGRGGMGSVYLAKDSRLDRLVALKVLAASVAEDDASVERFRYEAKAASKFTHPNIAHIYDFGEADGRYFLAMEYLEGRTLRALISEKFFDRDRAISVAAQVADALAAAHRNGFIHRDIKPENIVITDDGTVKALDFGLAKRIKSADRPASLNSTQTVPEMVLGTTPYMSPEQIRGETVDGRADIWALGVILYEMLAGERPFHGDNIADTMSAVLKDDPGGFDRMENEHGKAITRVVRRCLSKTPVGRFGSARDLAFLLENMTGSDDHRTSNRFRSLRYTVVRSALKRNRNRVLIAGVIALVLGGLVFGVYRSTNLFRSALRSDHQPLYQQVTFQRGTVWTARFAPDGQTLIYSATWNGNPLNIFRTRQSSPESRSFDLPDRKLLSISSKGDMAILRPDTYLYQFIHRGTLARLPIEGGAPREIAEDIQEADWSPDGDGLAVVRWIDGRKRLEFPIGTVLVDTTGYVSNPRFSPDGKSIAFLEHDKQWDNEGTVSIVDLHGTKKPLTDNFSGLEGLAWYPKTGEIWFTASLNGEAYALYAVNTLGEVRLVERVPANEMLFDISADNRVLLSRAAQSTDIYGLPPGEHAERNL